jgi:CubicO group peptidase (beta-lactamase class C family)
MRSSHFLKKIITEMKEFAFFSLFSLAAVTAFSQIADSSKKVMNGFPPSRESQVSLQNYRDYPFSKWSFRNMGAPMHTLMIPRGGKVHRFKESKNNFGQLKIANTQGMQESIEDIFANNETDGVIIVQNNTILYENYWNKLSRDFQHIWFSMTKSLTGSAFGLLVNQGKIDLSASPSKYVHELKGTPWERTKIQDVLNMSTALGYEETYTDTASYFYKYYGGASRFFYVPGADTVTTKSSILGTYDFLAKMATAKEDQKPGMVFEYNSSNVDVISWIMNRITGQPYEQFICENIWSKLGTEHDAFITTDRAYTAMATGGMNTTLRDAALFATMILNRGRMDGKQIIPSKWVDETLRLNEEDKERMKRNDLYARSGLPWMAYKNLWWILDPVKGEYGAVGIHGQVMYIHRAAKLVIVYFSSHPVASSAASKNFLPKLNACREIGKRLTT